MKRAVLIASMAGLLGADPLHAQTSAASPPVPPADAPAGSCELHVFPATTMIAVNNLAGAGYLFGGGALGAAAGSAIHGSKRSSSEALSNELPPSTQLAAVRNIASLGSIIGQRDPVIIEEAALADEEVPERSKARLTASAAPCYAELAIWSVTFEGVGGPKLQIVTYFRTYQPKTGKMSIHNEIQFGKLHVFPPRSADEAVAAHAELVAVFSAVLEKSLRLMAGTG